ncbi:hypothetical protein HpCK54_07780 [Helicobacter pylori]
MPLPFILAGVAIAAAGYGVKKGIDALDADCEADDFIKKAESLKEEAKRKADSVDSVRSSRNQALVRLGKKKLHILSHTASNFLDHFHRLERLYDTYRYNQKEKDQLSVTVSTLSTLSAFLKVPIMDEHQKLNEKTQKALNLMRDQMDSLENGNYSLRDISFRQARLEDLRDDDKTS